MFFQNVPFKLRLWGNVALVVSILLSWNEMFWKFSFLCYCHCIMYKDECTFYVLWDAYAFCCIYMELISNPMSSYTYIVPLLLELRVRVFTGSRVGGELWGSRERFQFSFFLQDRYILLIISLLCVYVYSAFIFCYSISSK